MENLFEDPNLDPTILEDSDEEMETSLDSEDDNINTTVLEVKQLDNEEQSV